MYVGFCLVNPLARDLLAVSIPLMALYPLTKRYTHWPQAILGLCMNYSCLVAYAHFAVTVDPWVVVPLYIGGWAWTLIYDSIYAYQDVKDDVLAGVKSTAILWRDDIKLYCGGLTVFVGASWALAGISAGWGVPYFIGLSGAVSHLTYTWASVDIKDPSSCAKKFVASKYTGVILLGGIIAAKLTKTHEQRKSS
jgi:4-hydroxybenzoate polyprenyltransferase